MMQLGELVVGKFQLDNLVGAVGTQLGRHAEEHVAFAVFAVEQGRYRHDAAFVPKDGLHDAGHRRGDAEVRAALRRDNLVASRTGLLFDLMRGDG